MKKEFKNWLKEQNFDHDSLGSLLEVLMNYNLDKSVTDHENQRFIHTVSTDDGGTILTTEKPIGYCKRSSGYVYPTSVEDYVGVSPELDENVDLSEMVLPNLDEEENPTKFADAVERKSKYKEPFKKLLTMVENDLTQEQWNELYKFDSTILD